MPRPACLIALNTNHPILHGVGWFFYVCCFKCFCVPDGQGIKAKSYYCLWAVGLSRSRVLPGGTGFATPFLTFLRCLGYVTTLNQRQTFRTGQHAPSGLRWFFMNQGNPSATLRPGIMRTFFPYSLYVCPSRYFTGSA